MICCTLRSWLRWLLWVTFAFAASCLALAQLSPSASAPEGSSVATAALPRAHVHWKAGVVPSAPQLHPESASPAAGTVSYFGGPVISSVQVVPVFWGAALNSQLTDPANGVGQFLSDLVSSPYLSGLGQYATNTPPSGGGAGTGQPIGPGSAVAPVTITPGNSSNSITDADVQTELIAQINAGVLPAPQLDATGNTTTLYLLFFPPSITITIIPGNASCQQFCYYNSTTTYTPTKQAMPYAVIPDLITSACSNGCGYNSQPMENVTQNLSYLLVDAITDPDVGLDTSSNYVAPLGWWAWQGRYWEQLGSYCNTFTGGNSLTYQGRTWNVGRWWSAYERFCLSSEADPTLLLSAPATSTGGTPFQITVTAVVSSSQDPLYLRTVHFSSSDAAATLPADYTFTAADAGAHNFPVTLASGGPQNLTVTDTADAAATSTATVTLPQQAQSITFSDPGPQTYGNVVTLSAAASSGLPITYLANGVPLSGNTFEVQSVANQVVTASQPGSSAYTAAAPVSYTLTVSPAPLTLAADNQAAAAGSALPDFTGTANGIIDVDQGVLIPAYQSAAVQGSPVGGYAIIPSFSDPAGRLQNYTVSYAAGTLAIFDPQVPLALSAVHLGDGSLLTVTGGNYNPNSVVLFNGQLMTTTYVSPTQLSAALSPDQRWSEQNSPSSAISVSNSAPVAGTSYALLLGRPTPYNTTALNIFSISVAPVNDGSGKYLANVTAQGLTLNPDGSSMDILWNNFPADTVSAGLNQEAVLIPGPQYEFSTQPALVEVDARSFSVVNSLAETFRVWLQ